MKKYLIVILSLLLPPILNGQTVATQEELLVIDVNTQSEAGNFIFENPKGSVSITGYSGQVILVTGKLRYPVSKEIEQGEMKRLDQYPFTMTAEVRGSEVQLFCELNGNTVDFDIKIPSHFSTRIKSQDNGEVTIFQVIGDIEVENPHGNITLLGITGSANLSSIDGSILADFKEVDVLKPIMISTLDGNVDLTVPEKSKMNFKLKSAQKEVNTDLEIERSSRPSIIKQNKGKKVYTMDDWTYGTMNGGGSECTLSTYNGNITIKKR